MKTSKKTQVAVTRTEVIRRLAAQGITVKRHGYLKALRAREDGAWLAARNCIAIRADGCLADIFFDQPHGPAWQMSRVVVMAGINTDPPERLPNAIRLAKRLEALLPEVPCSFCAAGGSRVSGSIVGGRIVRHVK